MNFFSSNVEGMLLNKIFMVESLIFKGAGAGEKNTPSRSRSK